MKTLSVFRKDSLILLKDRGTYINLFVLPLMFSIVLTLALGGVFGGGSSSSPVTIPVSASTPQAKELADEIAKIPGITWKRTSESNARSMVGASKAIGAVIVSNDGTSLSFYEDPTQLTNAQLLYGQLRSFTTAVSLTRQIAAIRAATGVPATTEQQGISVSSSRASETGKSVRPTAAEQYIPGFTVAFLFFIASTIAQYMFMERERGTLRRLMASPVRRSSILLGKLLPNVVIGFGQVVVIFAVGKLLFGMNLGNPLALLLVTCAAVAAANGFGLMVTSLSKTQAQATGLSTLLVFTLATVAGCYVPLSFMPPFMQSVALATPQGWAMSAFQSIVIKGADASQIMLNVAVLLGFAGVFFVVGLSRFRFIDR